MPKRTPKQTIVLHREGARVVPEIGKPFDFTADELKDIQAVNPEAIGPNVTEAKDDDHQEKEKAEPKTPDTKTTDTKPAPAAKPVVKTSGTEGL